MLTATSFLSIGRISSLTASSAFSSPSLFSSATALTSLEEEHVDVVEEEVADEEPDPDYEAKESYNVY